MFLMTCIRAMCCFSLFCNGYIDTYVCIQTRLHVQYIITSHKHTTSSTLMIYCIYTEARNIDNPAFAQGENVNQAQTIFCEFNYI